MTLDLSRRSMLKMMGVLGAAAAGCGEVPGREIMPYVVPDENVVPGMPSFFAGLCTECEAGCGVIARVREGRAIKLEGNPSNPIGGGALCARGQAALQGLYNPDRLPEPRARQSDGRATPIGWEAALDTLRRRLAAAASAGADRVAFVSAPAGPTLERLAERWIRSWGSGRRLAYRALDESAARAAGARCFGRRDLPVHRLDAATCVVSFGADFLETWRSPVEYGRQYAAFRVPRGTDTSRVGRLVYVGSRFGLTAANGDEWLSTRAGGEAAAALAILHAVARQLADGPDLAAVRRFTAPYVPEAMAEVSGVSPDDVARVAAWFAGADGALALAGTDDEATHVAAHLLNHVTGNVGRTVRFLEGDADGPEATLEETAALLDAMRGGAVDVCVVAGANPLFTLPAELRAAEAFGRVPFVVWCGQVPDETAAAAHLLLPVDHALETWGDAMPRPGVIVLGQPVMQPVYATLPLGDVLLATARDAPTGGEQPWDGMRAAVEATWRDLHARRNERAPFDAFWERVRREGGLFEDAPVARVTLRPDALAAPLAVPSPPDGLAVMVFPHLLLGDGRGADEPWLQEVPEPISQLVWDTWVAVHPETAKTLGVARDDVLELRSPHGTIAAPALPTPHVRPGVLAVPLGQGHTAYGRYAEHRGANAWRLLPRGRRWTEVEARRTGERRALVSPQSGLDVTLGRPLALAIDLAELARGEKPEWVEPPPPEPYELRPRHEYVHRWGMTIDLAACTGCSACVVACYAENNVPVVGRENVARGQWMAWLRIERFVPTSPAAPPLHLLPMLCQQCDHAPCEPVCPVYASVHSDEGINAQVYNRCIGTRYCNNNCPYKVRRFNWFAPEWPAPLHLQLNPDVTVRGAGVMEKCTFCIQRIRFAEENAREEGRPVRDGEVQTACQQACPAQAITFGDMKDDGAAVLRRRRDHGVRTYRALEDLNTKPAIVYLAEVYRSRERG